MSEWRLIKNELAHGASILRGAPFQCLVQVTNRCNMRCDFCDFWPNGASPKAELSLDDYRRLSDGLHEMGTFLISIEGGEPLLRREVVSIVAAFARHHLPVLFTNGWHVTPALGRALFDAGLAQVGVSIDFPDAARHDHRRDLAGACDRAWEAVRSLKAAAPRGGQQVHVMTVVMRENQHDIEMLLRQSEAAGVGHNLTLISGVGHRRGWGSKLPVAPLSAYLLRLWRRYRHLRLYGEYFEGIDPFLCGEALPRCRAGQQSFNVDHLGNVSPCIEKIQRIVGNVREEPLQQIVARMADDPEVAQCQDCWTLCRGVSQIMGAGGSWRGWRDLMARRQSL